MADFFKAYSKTAVNEGGYVNDPNDHGGETWRGIARNIHHSWSGWPIIDLYKGKPDFKEKLEEDRNLQYQVLKFYKAEYWDQMRGDELMDQEVANSIYDSCVNMGVKTGIKLAQRSLGLTENGAMSSFLVKMLNNKQ